MRTDAERAALRLVRAVQAPEPVKGANINLSGGGGADSSTLLLGLEIAGTGGEPVP
jgi:hypothetical protein